MRRVKEGTNNDLVMKATSMKPYYTVNGTTSRDLTLLGIIPTTLDNSIPIENVHCLIQFLLY